MYKTLLNKGFKPTYYTNDDWLKSRECKSRLFYKYKVETKELLNSILNTLDIFDEYFFVLENDDAIVEIEVCEDLNEFWIYFYNTDTENYKIPSEKIEDMFKVIPNDFIFEYCD